MASGRQVSTPKNGTEPLVPTTAAAWRAGEVYTLPSGYSARLRRPGLMAMLATGQIPNPLAAKVTKLLTLVTTEEIQKRTQEERERALLSNSEAFVAIAALAFIEPKLITDRLPDHDKSEIGPADLSDRDLMWVYYDFVEGTAADVVDFREVRRTAQS